jgi:hypothetical protein
MKPRIDIPANPITKSILVHMFDGEFITDALEV